MEATNILKELLEKSREIREEDFYSLIGIRQIQAISDLIKGYEQLERENAVAKPVLKQNARLFEENRKLKEKIIKIQEQNKAIVNKNYIPKSVIRDKIDGELQESDFLKEIDNFNGSKENQKYYCDGYKDAILFIKDMLGDE